MSAEPVNYPCPVCRAPADLVRGCSGCGRPGDPAAAEVVRLNGVLATLTAEVDRRERALAAVRQELAQTQTRRTQLAAQVRASLAPRPPVPVRHPVPAPPPIPMPPPYQVRAARPVAEVSTRGVQTVLFVIGGLLLGAGAIVFMVVAWTRFGLLGQASILAAGTGLALAAPGLANWRRLPATAETLAVIAVLALLLDGYAAWRAGLVDGVSASSWAGSVVAMVALASFGYARLLRRSSPRFAGLLLGQAAVPLLAATSVQTLPDWVIGSATVGYLLLGLAAGNLLVSWWWGRSVAPSRVQSVLIGLAWAATGCWLGAAGLAGGVSLLGSASATQAVAAGGALLAVAALLVGAVWVAGRTAPSAAAMPVLVTGAAVVVVLLVTLVGIRLVVLAWPGVGLVGLAAVVAMVGLTGSLGAPGARGWAGSPAARGRWLGGLLAVGLTGWLVGWLALLNGSEAIRYAHLGGSGSASGQLLLGWQLPVAIGLVLVALLRLVPAGRVEFVVAGTGLLALAVPPALGWPWWAPVGVSLLAATAVILLSSAGGAAAGAGALRRLLIGGGIAAGLAGQALFVGAGTAAGFAAGLAGVGLLGLGVAVRFYPRGTERPDPPERPERASLVIGRVGMLAGLAVWPPAIAFALVAAGLSSPWPAAAGFAGAGLLLGAAVLVRRQAPGYLSVATAALHAVTPMALVAGFTAPASGRGALATAFAGPLGWYLAAALLVLVLSGLLIPPAHPQRWLLRRLPLVFAVVGLATPALATLLLGPYSWLGGPWSGAPVGPGVLAFGQSPVGQAVAVSLAGLGAAAGVAARVLTGRWVPGLVTAGAILPLAGLVALVEVGAPWPTVPVLSLLLGLAAVTWAAVRGAGLPAAAGTGYGLVLTGAGLAGALPERWSTLLGLGLVLVATLMVAAAGRVPAVRAIGWVAATGAGCLLAITATAGASLARPWTGGAVLAVAAAGLAASALPRLGRGERAAAEAAGHGAAFVALLWLLGRPELVAVALVTWGLLVGLRALRPSESVAGRAGRVATAAGCQLVAWWLLLTVWQVVAVEAYTVPVAAIALGLGGWARYRRRAGAAEALGSWPAYGPALAAAVLPTLALSLADPAPLRRLLLGVGAVVLLLLGARWRLQASVVVGGLVAGLVAVRELALLWQRWDAWIPLTVAGLLLVGLAATYERRRRDLTRLRAALGRLG